MPTAEGSGVARSILKNIFGLSPNTVNRVMQIIKDSPDNQNVKTSQMRTRVGARAMQYVRNAIEQSQARPTNKKEDEKESKANQMKAEEEKEEKESLKEGEMPFLNTLMEIGARQAAMMTPTDREGRREMAMQTDREYRQGVEKELRDLEQSDDPDKKMLAQKRKEVAMLTKRVADKERQQPQPQPSGMPTAGGLTR